jgi:diguanylate cyclase (GGDEF)-like protein
MKYWRVFLTARYDPWSAPAPKAAPPSARAFSRKPVTLSQPTPNGAQDLLRSESSTAPQQHFLNRAQFIDRLGRELRRTKMSLTDRHVVLSVDIDRFRFITASFGRGTGDQLLNAIATRIGGFLTRQDALARAGGDEFLVLIEETRAGHTALEVSEKIQRELIGGFEIDGSTIYTTASIGMARVASGYASPEDVVRDSEIAMYQAKTRGRARAEQFHPTMFSRAIDLFDLESDLRRALDRSEFELVYQPIVSVKTGRVRAFESLLRWNHPIRGLQTPSSFLGLLKETGLILSVGQWVINEACRQAKEWDDIRGRPIPVTINLAPQQFSHSSVINTVTDAMEATGVHPGAVILEITEDALIDDLEAARQTLLPLRLRGVRTMIDDFGTGYSSLSYLRRLPVDAIKIDASFVDRMERFTEDRMIVRAIVALAHALELCVVAEGVERDEQLAELIGLDCEEAQGYLISPPVDAATATEMVRSRWSAPQIKPAES